ncbi:TetR family transcriptional regulator [Nakamurella flavida]|uniref:TetR family transcriptional regulator n=1 Tax=Nakamurella flavida TaxID=363630 RepID=A0A939C0J0_9ACTN|nr:TetR family transcriptional regulator [Nakamurella flavida]MBM9476773.1 TetR family transcriptional regulator [Nakamurella flavida]MDP9778789.1 DNA-binding transcriptional regulator YbjK [Nakamurella flavida]
MPERSGLVPTDPTSEPDGGGDRSVARRPDPGRRDRIIDACLDVVAADGVAGTSHRKVAAAAGVPLGSMTYHFTGIDDLLHEAFTRFADRVADGFDLRMHRAGDRAAARRAVVALIVEDVFAERRDLAVTLELYALAARRPAYRAITDAWMARSRTALGVHFTPEEATQLDALVEGLTLHRALSLRAPGGSDTGDPADTTDTAAVTRAVERVTAGVPEVSRTGGRLRRRRWGRDNGG